MKLLWTIDASGITIILKMNTTHIPKSAYRYIRTNRRNVDRQRKKKDRQMPIKMEIVRNILALVIIIIIILLL